jgi:hypothetical protein
MSLRRAAVDNRANNLAQAKTQIDDLTNQTAPAPLINNAPSFTDKLKCTLAAMLY